MELLESDSARPRQARYQAALRPDMKYVKIIKDFPTERLLHLTSRSTVPKLCQMDFTEPSLCQKSKAFHRWILNYKAHVIRNTDMCQALLTDVWYEASHRESR